MIRTHNLHKTHGRGGGRVDALRDINISVRRGEFLALMGPSGSGKSSLMSIIGLLDTPSAGTLEFNGQDVTGLSRDQMSDLRNRHIGYIFQSYHLLNRRTALGNVELPLLYRGVRRPERRNRAMEALEQVGLADRCNALPPDMSGGEQQRVAIARALVGAPDLIFADEPTGALDSKTGKQILLLLNQIHDAGRTVVLVTHDPSMAAGALRLKFQMQHPSPTGIGCCYEQTKQAPQ